MDERRRKRLRILKRLEILRKINDNTKKFKRKRKRFWVRQIYKKREELGVFWTLLQELKQDHEYFFRYLRMTPKDLIIFKNLFFDVHHYHGFVACHFKSL